MVNTVLLKAIRFTDLNKWSANYALFTKIKSAYPLVPLSDVLTRVKNSVVIKDEVRYKRITVRLYGQGVLKRDELYGKEIGTKKQFVAQEGQLIISRIDARNGAFGIVPEELDGAIVTNDFWLFDVKNALPQYLTLVLSSERFQQYWYTKSSGTTNRQRIDEDNFLMSKILLPPLKIQRVLLQNYDKAILDALKKEQEAAEIQLDNENYLMDILNLHHDETPQSISLLTFVSYKKLAGRWEWNVLSEVIEKSIKDCIYPIVPLGQAVSFVNRTWKKRQYTAPSHFMYIEIGGINATENTATANKVLISDAPSRATQTVVCGDLIIGTTRPYLKRFALIRESEDGYVCSSGFQVIEKSANYDLRYIMEALKLEPVVKQFESLMTGALYPAVNAEQLKEIRIPVPPVDVQRSIANHIEQEKVKSKILYQQAHKLRELAREEFEEVVFGEA